MKTKKDFYHTSDYYKVLIPIKGLVEALLANKSLVGISHRMRVRISNEIHIQLCQIKRDDVDVDFALISALKKLNFKMCHDLPYDVYLDDMTHYDKVEISLIMRQILETIILPLEKEFEEEAIEKLSAYEKKVKVNVKICNHQDKDFDKDVPF